MARVTRGEVWLVSLDPTVGREIQKTRPCVVVQNDIANELSDVTIIIPLTSQQLEKIYPGQVLVSKQELKSGISSKILCQQIRCVDKSRLVKKVGVLTQSTMHDVDTQLQIALGLY